MSENRDLHGTPVVDVRRGANWTPPKTGRCFLALAETETCMYCEKHISRHYGMTEYRCDPKPEAPSDELVDICDDCGVQFTISQGRGCGCPMRTFEEDNKRLRAELEAARAVLDDFMREVGAALLGAPEDGTEWGGGGILDGIRDLKRDRERLHVLLRAIKDGPDRIAGCACYHLASAALERAP